MDPSRLRELLARVQTGALDVDTALGELGDLPYRDLGFASVDHHRALRHGAPEVVFGAGKTAEQIVHIAAEVLRGGHNLLVTRLDADKATALAAAQPGLRYAAAARVARLEPTPPRARPCRHVAVVCAGTSDIPCAEEAVETLEALGLEPRRTYDVGVAGLHRLLDRVPDLRTASAAIVLAGMEGALPSVVGGLVGCPVVAVPTSIGYGAAFGGLTALFGMLTSCASGVTVVNIDNGFGAAMAVHRMLPRAEPPRPGDPP
ncbi:MAG: nickel pincer cofactor biosynthesis protein LarB [Myxococcales bacterium]|nr:nickel pincer cofactor biosynthesis protein LarB [Myxococcales bacterium]